MDALPTLPVGREWPAHMLGAGPLLAGLRETYARISHRVAAAEDLAREKEAALAWCRTNGNPHRRHALRVGASMTDSIIDRAARALAKAQSGTDDWDGLDESLQEKLREEVRAVLEAIREPSEAMIDEGEAVESDPYGMAKWDAQNCWEAMIDKALAE